MTISFITYIYTLVRLVPSHLTSSHPPGSTQFYYGVHLPRFLGQSAPGLFITNLHFNEINIYISHILINYLTISLLFNCFNHCFDTIYLVTTFRFSRLAVGTVISNSLLYFPLYTSKNSQIFPHA